MKIGEYELSDNDLICANKIISEFYGHPCEITSGSICLGGRSMETKSHYIIESKEHRSSIKLPYNVKYTHDIECIVNEIRDIFNMENYNIKLIGGFPMNGEKWRKGNILLIYWGIKDNRTNLARLDSRSLSPEDRKIFLKQMAINAAFVYYLDIWDRASRNFVWDKIEKKLISIDHEKLSHSDRDTDITDYISDILGEFCGSNWYNNTELKNYFEQEFKEMWDLMVASNTVIENIFKKYDQPFNQNDKKRIENGAEVPCSLITTPSIGKQ